MTREFSCDYCGVKGAKVRRPGEPPMCHSHSDIPALELKRDRELERLQRDLYEGAGRAARRESQPEVESWRRPVAGVEEELGAEPLTRG